MMLSVPNHGSQLADILQNYWLYRFVTGSAGQELTTDLLRLLYIKRINGVRPVIPYLYQGTQINSI